MKTRLLQMSSLGQAEGRLPRKRSSPRKRGSGFHRSTAALLLVTFTLTFLIQDRVWASPGGGSSAAGSAGAPAGRILESFHSDLSTGRAVFGIPIAVPPGRRGVQPGLGLSYSSSGKNGPIGVGWDLELGSIERSTRFGLPKFDSTDTFVLKFGGITADLAEISPGEYRLKDEQLFAKIVLTGTSWTLTTKDGTTATFGAAANSQWVFPRGTVSWFLNEVRDLQGNSLTITYTPSGRQVYLSSITYTAHPATGLLPPHEVKFTWESRPDVEWDERFGDRIESSQRLQKVEAFTNGSLVRRYSLSYTSSPITGRSMLTSVTTIGSDGLTSLPALRLRSSDTWGGWVLTNNWSDPPPTAPLYFLNAQGVDTGMRLEEVTGDGRVDLLKGAVSDLRAWRNIGTNSSSGSGWVEDNRWAPPYPFVAPDGTDAGARFADFNGDGRIDLYYGRSGVGPERAAYLNTGSGWVRDDRWDFAPGYGSVHFAGGVGQDMGSRFIDLNGDGKADLLHGNNGDFRAWLNTGSGWVEDSRWAPPKNFTDANGADQGCRLVDLNGDGLVDLFYAGPQEQAVYLNTGSGWKRETAWNSGEFANVQFIGPNREDLGWRLLDVNGDGLADLVYAKQNEPGRVLINTGTGWKREDRWAAPYPFVGTLGQDLGARFGDLNGDGITDIQYGTPSYRGGYMWGSLPPATPPDLLTQVDNGIGGTTRLTYRPSTQYDNTGGDGIEDLPFVTQTVATQTIDNGLGWSATTNFTYSGAKFDPAERDFLGFAYAKVTDPIGSTAESWFHQDVHLKGRPYKQEAKDSSGSLFTRSENSWACRDLFTTSKGNVHFCHLAGSTSTVFDGDTSSKQTKVDYTYDDYGNVIQQVEQGDTSVLGDERTATTEYTFNPAAWLMGFPSHAVVTDSGGVKLSESWITYDGNALPADLPTKGLVTKTESWLSTGPPNPIATATYDLYGNKLTSTDSLNRTTATTYDAQATFPIQVANFLGHTLQTTYDPGTGNILTTTDPNGQVTQNQYDALGRLIAVIGPDDTASAPGVKYAYDLSMLPTRVTKQVKASPFGVSLSNPEHYYTTYGFSDGLGRTIQVRSPAKDPAKQIVTGNVELGSRGETAAQYLSYFSPVSSSYSAPASGIPKARYEYDAMGRLVKVTDPDGAVVKTTYNDWTVTFTDANGNQTVKESDAYGRLIKVTESGTGDHSAGTTTYTYDPAGRLTKVADAKNNVTTMAYDSFGRKLSMADTDMAGWSYSYDLAGNLLKQTDAKGQILEFSYDPLNRLTQKKGKSSAAATSYAIFASYTYDAGTYANTPKLNMTGRLSKVTDPSGSTEFFYDKLGRETKTVKMIGSSFFTVQREYDSLNRLTRLIYPDNKTDLRYEYSAQGINRIYSLNADGSTQEVLTNADANAAGETLKMALGNGVTTDYSYDPNTLRIASIRTTNTLGNTLQEMNYQFDPVGNLTGLNDRVNSAGQSFRYDALNRLSSATGSYGSNQYHYDALGDLTSKDNGTALTYPAAGGIKPHAATKFQVPGQSAVTLTYDANGNLTKKGSQTFSYDLQNRLTNVSTLGGQPGTVSFTLQPGWNCVGHPFDRLSDRPDSVEGRSIRDVLGSLTLGTDYDQVSKSVIPTSSSSSGTSSSSSGSTGGSPWKSFVGDNNADETTTLDFAQGFWIHVNKTSSVVLSIAGTTPYPQKSISLIKGWNLIAAPKLVATALSGSLTGLTAGTDYSEVKRWNEVSQSFEALSATSTIQPGQALWINMLKARSWTYPAPTKTTVASYTYDGDGGRVKVTVDGKSSLYVGEMYEVLPGSITRSHLFFGPTRLATLERGPILIASNSSFRDSNSSSFRGREASEKSRSLYASLRKFFRAIEETFVCTAYADVVLPAGVKLQFYHGDHLGSINVITDHTGKQVKLAEYSPFGSTVRADSGSSSSSSGSSSSSSGSTGGSSFGFTGKRLDDSTGLYYFHARYYDPELGRFIQPDTLVQAPSDPQTLNRYTYCRNNPLIYTEPTGHKFSWKKFWHAAVGAIVGVVAAIVLGPAGLALVGSTMAGIIGGAIWRCHCRWFRRWLERGPHRRGSRRGPRWSRRLGGGRGSGDDCPPVCLSGDVCGRCR